MPFLTPFIGRKARAFCVFGLVLLFALSFFAIWLFSSSHLLFAAQNEQDKQELEQQLAALESEILNLESIVSDYQKQNKTLQGEIDLLNAKIRKLNLQIKATNLTIQKLDKEIEENQKNINTIEDSIDLNKNALTKTIQKIYENESANLLMVLLKNGTLSEFFGDINNWFELQESLSITIRRIRELRSKLIDEKEAMAIKREDAAALKSSQDAQRASIASLKGAKDNLLKTTKGKESDYKKILDVTRKTAAQIRNRIFEFLGGGSLTFEEAYKFAKFAEQETGIRAALILAVLDRESALGQNVGRCSYETAMHPTRDLPIFLALVSELRSAGKAPPEPILVSCANRDGAFGGAMGPAQFIPSTWEIYKKKIARITASDPPNPWSHIDAFVGTALYLKDNYFSKACEDYSREVPSDKQTLQERCAAAKYYAGGRWYRYRWAYGEPVVDRAEKFQKDIDILNS